MTSKKKIKEEDVEKEAEQSFSLSIDGADFSIQEKEFVKIVEKYKADNNIIYPGVVEIFRLAKKYLKKK